MARTPKLTLGQKKKVEKVMHEYKEGQLKSGKPGPAKSGKRYGPKVKSRKQAIAIALSEAGANRPTKKTTTRKTTPRKVARGNTRGHVSRGSHRSGARN